MDTTDILSEIIAAVSTEPNPDIRCGRCGHLTPDANISVTGPYRTCPPCTQIIRG